MSSRDRDLADNLAQFGLLRSDGAGGFEPSAPNLLSIGGNMVLAGRDGQALIAAAELRGVSPDATAAANSVALQEALNAAGVVTITTPGTYLISATPIFYDNTHLLLGPGVKIKIATGEQCNFGRNEHWNSTVVGVTSATPSLISGASYKITLACNLPNVAVGKFVIIKGDNTDNYNGIHRVEEIVAGVSITIYLRRNLGGTNFPTLTVGSTLLGVASFSMANSGATLNKAPGTGYLAGVEGAAFYATIAGGDGSGAIAQINTTATGSIESVHVGDPGRGYTTFAGATIDLSVGGGGAAVAIADICTPHMLSVALANSDITIEGGEWDWNVENSGAVEQHNRHGFVFNKVANLRMEHIDYNEVSYYCLYYANVQNLYYANIRGMGNHAQGVGPVWGAQFLNIEGEGSDDFLAVSVNNGIDPTDNNDDYTSIDLPDANGEVRNVVYDRLFSKRCNNMVAIFPGRGFPISGIKISNLFSDSALGTATPQEWLSPASNVSTAGIPYIYCSDVTGVREGMLVIGQSKADETFVTAIEAGTYGGHTRRITLTANNIDTVTNKKILFVQPRVAPRVNNFVSLHPLGSGECLLNNVEIDGLNGDTVGGLINIGPGPSGATLVLDSLRVRNIAGMGYRIGESVIGISVGATINELLLDGVEARYNAQSTTGGDNLLRVVNNAGTIKHTSMKALRVNTIGGNKAITAFYNAVGAVANIVDIQGSTFTGSNEDTYGTSYFFQQDSAAFATQFNLFNCSQVSGGAVATGAQSFDLSMDGVNCTGLFPYSLIRLYASGNTHNLKIANFTNTTGGALMSGGAANTVNLLAGDSTAKFDLSHLSRAGSAGAMCVASPGSGSGSGDILTGNLAVCDATGAAGSWKQVSAPTTRSY